MLTLTGERKPSTASLFSETAGVCEDPACQAASGQWWRRIRRRRAIQLQNHFYCGADCFERGAAAMVRRLMPLPSPRRQAHRVPIGLLMLSAGMIGQEQLRAALEAQRNTGSGRLGEWLCSQGAATTNDVAAALGMQWSRPVYPIAARSSSEQLMTLIPLAVLEKSHCLPVHFNNGTRVLHIAFAFGIEHSVLTAAESVLDCRAEGCIAEQSALEQQLTLFRSASRPAEIVFESKFTPEEIARTVRSYAVTLRASTVQMVACSGLIWVFLESPLQNTHLVFRSSRETRHEDRNESVRPPVWTAS